MKPQRLVILVLAGLALWLFAGRLVVLAPAVPAGADPVRLYRGRGALLSPRPSPGTVAQLGVRRGQRVAAGAPLFVIEPRPARRPGGQGSRPSCGAARPRPRTRARASARSSWRSSKPSATPPARPRARRARCSNRTASWSGAASMPASGSTTRAPPMHGRRAPGVAAGRGSSTRRRSAAREDQIRAADARVAQAAAAARRDRRPHRRHGAGRALARRGSRTSFTSAANGRRPTSRSVACSPTTASMSASSCPRSGRRLPARAHRSASAATAAPTSSAPHLLCQPAARIHAADHLQPREPRPAGVHGRGAAGAAAASCPAFPSTSCRSEPAAVTVGDRRRRPQQVLRRPARGPGLLDRGRAGPDHRLPRSQRLGQDHDPADAVRAAHARQRRGHAPRLRHHRARAARSSAAPAT